jgi:hypothetical protein
MFELPGELEEAGGTGAEQDSAKVLPQRNILK